jgi:ParB-like chromosome segregation protein Spo0J
VEQLRSSYAPLRPGALKRVPDDVAQMPIRVVPTEEGLYEVIDGFKRLAGWRRQGHPFIPVVVEPPGSSTDHKRLLLLANSPPRTLTALDEARVVCSLMSEEGLSAASIARRLGRKPQWVARRVEIGTRLSPVAEGKLAQGEIGPTLAHALSAKEQEAALSAMERHGLKLPETLALISAYRVADEADRR